jgi:IS5 family transposase
VKASIVTTNARAPGGQFVLHAKALPRNPYDGHTLAEVIEATETLTGCAIQRAYVDKGYRGHQTPNPHRVFYLGPAAGSFWRDQTRVATPLSHRSGHRTYENRWPPRPLFSQRPRGRCD